MSEQFPDSLLSPDGTMPDSSVVTRIRQAEADVVFQTQGQKDRAIELIKAGDAKTIDEAYKIMREEASENPSNDAYIPRK